MRPVHQPVRSAAESHGTRAGSVATTPRRTSRSAREKASRPSTCSSSKSRPLAKAFSRRTRWQKAWIVAIVGAVERVERAADALAGSVVDVPEVPRTDLLLGRQRRLAPVQLLELGAHAQAQLVRGLLGERHDQDAVDGHVAREQQLHDEVLQREGLARPG